MQSINIYIGYDDIEAIAYHTAVQSIMDNTGYPNVKITPLNTRILREYGAYKRPRDAKQTTEFSYTRFLVPYLSGYSGRAIFMDSDVLVLSDIAQLWDATDPLNTAGFPSVSVVKHDYTPKTKTKHLGRPQTAYACKNWSSVMVFNCSHNHCQRLTPEYVNSASGLELHQFKWTTEDRIGELEPTWNWLVGEYEFRENVNLVHFTLGGPWFADSEYCDYANDWYKYCERVMGTAAAPS